MAVIYREPGSFKALMKELRKRGINNFNSVSEIDHFIQHYETERLRIIEETKSEINRDVLEKRARIEAYKKDLKTLHENVRTELNHKIKTYTIKLRELEDKHSNRFLIFRIINRFRYNKTAKKLRFVRENFDTIIRKKSKTINKKIADGRIEIDYIINNKETVLANRSKKKIRKIKYIFDTLHELHPLISGAIGELRVVEEVRDLPENYILINDFSLRFSNPIYNKSTREKIFSIQIDHILISPAGIFLIETKNWSKESINNYELWSPVEQILRSSYAMFVILNNGMLQGIGSHHWGERRIPVRNLIVMINHKPKTDFKYVKVLRLHELLRYISYFDEIYTKDDVNKISEKLLNLVGW